MSYRFFSSALSLRVGAMLAGSCHGRQKSAVGEAIRRCGTSCAHTAIGVGVGARVDCGVAVGVGVGVGLRLRLGRLGFDSGGG